MELDNLKLRERYEELRPHLKLLKKQLRTLLDRHVRDLGIGDARIEGRVKRFDSLVMKAIKKGWNDPFLEASDMVGVRADLVYRRDVDRLAESVRNSEELRVIKVENKIETYGEDRFNYEGIHIDVLPHDLPKGLPSDLGGCEIQVRSNAQAAWAMAVHDIIYKGPVEVDSGTKRRLNRLTALLEIFDSEVDTAREALMKSDGFTIAKVTEALNGIRLRYAAHATYDREFTRIVLCGLLSELESTQADDLVSSLNDWASTNAKKLSDVYGRYTSGARFGPVLLNQPEALATFYFIDSDIHALARKWATIEVPYRELEELTDAWGGALPDPV